MQIELDTNKELQDAKLKVIGVGGGGGNAINNMIHTGLEGVGFIAANTDKQALNHNLASITIQLGPETTKGLGAGANPEVGLKAAEESIDDIRKALENTDMVFVTAGMGGGTGTGGVSVVAEVAQKEGALVVAIVTKPFKFEGKKRQKIADEWIKKLRESVDALIIIPNQRLLEIIDANTQFSEAYKKVDEVLYNATKGIADIIGCHGLVNVDFADVKSIMKGMGDALMGIGVASGEDRAQKATGNALNSPLLDGLSIKGAKGILVNITGSENLSMMEVSNAVSIVEEAAGGDVNLIHGVVIDNDLTDEIYVTVVATGFSTDNHSDTDVVTSENNIQERIPYDTIEDSRVSIHQTDTKPVRIPNVSFNGNGRNQSIRKEFTDADQNTAPRGSDELKGYDIPAFVRRQKSNQNFEHSRDKK